MRKLVFAAALVAASFGATAAPAGAYWVCVGVTPLDVAVCQDDPMPGPPPLPGGSPEDPEPGAAVSL